MPLSPEKIADLRLKQFEMLQGVVARMSAQSATLKNYCVTISMAIAGFAITLQRPIVALLTLVPILSFAFLDARYLQQERRFRGRFDAVAAEGWETPPTFEMGKTANPVSPYWSAFFSWSVAGFYLPLVIVAVTAVAISRQVYDKLL
ncbi:hypothetical protein [Bradyrhizobium erythrophlei]|uniref:Uncharacterized protein n=1 Tax=Bradyrhizobium erythrophlei TaxID=1437360 RepID=A0A1H4XHQ0_9BRAD|nr:hypothetical protein [Bradyrhizobium erythrophlei]SED04468.1 hypothetical protein SAMN05444164_3514 [Bradyrhizobium erythrophlei]